MNFYDLIAKYKYTCNKKLEENTLLQEELQEELNTARQYINNLNSQLRMSPFIAGCAGVSMLFASMFISFFGTYIWIITAIIGTLLTAIGYLQEQSNESFEKHKKEWYNYYSSLSEENALAKVEEQNLKFLLKDVITCCNYYMYLVNEEQQKIPINIDIEEVIESTCLLSTYLDKFYTQELEEFQKLSSKEKRQQERQINIIRKINEAKNPKSEEGIPLTERTHRRRRVSQNTEQPIVLEYPDRFKRA